MTDTPRITRLTLAHPRSRWRLQLAPARGAAFVSLEARTAQGWQAVAQPPSAEQWRADERLRFSNYALLPYSNRVPWGRLRAGHEGEPWLPPNLKDHPHPLHGLGWLQAWTPVRPLGPRELRLNLSWPGGPAWPWAFEAAQRLRLLGADVLQLDLSLRNSSPRRAPAGLGWHPYFRATPELLLQARLPRQQTQDADGIARGWQPSPRALREGRAARHDALPPLDDGFAGWDGRACLDWPGLRVRLQARGALRRHCVVYRPDGQPYVCIEPVSHANHALGQSRLRAQAWGQRWLNPGQTLRGSLRLRLG